MLWKFECSHDHTMSRYDTEKFLVPPDVELVCCICQGVLDTPVETPCRHVFCRSCVTTWLSSNSTCPTCRRRFTGRTQLQPVLPIVMNMINKMLMKCDYREYGCMKAVQLEHHAHHVRLDCEFEPVQCAHKGCKETVLKRDRDEHEQKCLFAPFTCQKGCGFVITKQEAEIHNCIKALKDKINELKEENDSLKAVVGMIDKKKLQEVMNSAENESAASTCPYCNDNSADNVRDDNGAEAAQASNSGSAYEVSDSESEDRRSIIVNVEDDQEEVGARGGRANNANNRAEAATSWDEASDSHDDSNSASDSDQSEMLVFLSSDEEQDALEENVAAGDGGNAGAPGSSGDVDNRGPNAEGEYNSESDASWEVGSRDRSTDVTISGELSEDERLEEGEVPIVRYTDVLNAYRSSETDNSWTPGQETPSEDEERSRRRRRPRSDSENSESHRRRKRRRRRVSSSSSGTNNSSDSTSSESCADSDSVSETGSDSGSSSDSSDY